MAAFKMSRRTTLGAMLGALPLVAIGRPAGAAEFEYKFATGQSPTNPINTRLQEGIDRIATATSGQLRIKLFPNNQLGSDTDLIYQVRAGGIEFLNVSNSVLSTLVPAAALVNVGFAFTSYDQVWKGVDGELSQFITAQIERVGIQVIGPYADNGFRRHVRPGAGRPRPGEGACLLHGLWRPAGADLRAGGSGWRPASASRPPSRAETVRSESAGIPRRG